MILRAMANILKLFSIFSLRASKPTVEPPVDSTHLIQPGMQRALDYLRRPLPPTQPIQDVILRGKFDNLQANAFRLNRIRSRLGRAWEFVFTDFGFNLVNNVIDVINPNRLIALELKNSWRTDNANSKKCVFDKLKTYKRNNPNYTVVYGAINYKPQIPGKHEIKENIHFMYGDVFLNYIFGMRKDNVINTLRTAFPPGNTTFLNKFGDFEDFDNVANEYHD